MEPNQLITSYKNALRLCCIAIGVTYLAFMPTVTSAVPALAPLTTATPLDCPAVIVVPGGYRLTQDSTCAGLGWGGVGLVRPVSPISFSTLTGSLSP
jgi:hypothetical protein